MKKHITINSLIEENKRNIANNRSNFSDDLLFEKGFKHLIQSTCRDTNSFVFYSKNYHSALKEARLNKMSTALSLVKRAKKYIQIEKLSEKEKRVYRCISYPIHGYLCYKIGDFEGAVEYTLKTIKVDEAFESAFPILFFHKLQQLHNLSRVFVKRSKYGEACRLVNMLLSCIVGNKSISYSSHFFDTAHFRAENDELRKLMGCQVFLETIILFNRLKSEAKVRDLFQHCFKDYEDWEDSRIFIGVTSWIIAKDSYYLHSDNFLSLVKKFLKKSADFHNEAPLENILKDVVCYLGINYKSASVSI